MMGDSWHHVHNEAYRRLGGVATVNRIDNLKTGIARGCGAWGEVNEQYHTYARTLGFLVDACEVRGTKNMIEARSRSLSNSPFERSGSRSCCPTTGSRCARPVKPRRTYRRLSLGPVSVPDELGAFVRTAPGSRVKTVPRTLSRAREWP
jgi:hypothetical protein